TMKKIILSVSFFIIAIVVNAQSPAFEWAKNMGGYNGSAHGKSVTTDLSGNIYTAGDFTGRVDFDPGAGTFDLIEAGINGKDIFISKSDASGNLIWAKRIGGAADNDQVWSIKVDGSGNVYITGHFAGTVDFDPGPGIFNLVTPDNFYTEMYILKLDASGNFIWAKQIGGSSFVIGRSIALDATGNVFATGYFYGTPDFDPGIGTFNLTSAGNEDIFIEKLDASGNFIWAKQMSGSLHEYGYSITLDVSQNIF